MSSSPPAASASTIRSSRPRIGTPLAVSLFSSPSPPSHTTPSCVPEPPHVVPLNLSSISSSGRRESPSMGETE
ncbi:hypothetical protein Tsubulata_002611 [Turnera subulata]|uniref:Uncharacterized protein n=1 Tax=Turnera subulata TaxID=218843 RepID=A0A9Q0FN48_9ROSI|nr:hypothetical protein Tsubulata_002611 [Turnera subulata]